MSHNRERDDTLPDPHYGLVTGTYYKEPRPAGNAPWNPAPETHAVLDKVRAISAEYRIALTVRQVFYRLVSRHGYPKIERAYGRLKEHILSARRAGLIDWDDIRDDGDVVPPLPGWGGLKEFWHYVRALASTYWRRPEGDVHIEVWVEADGMVLQLQTVADPFGVRVIGGGGTKSVTQLRNASLRFQVIEAQRPVSVILIGDFDPTGRTVMDRAALEVRCFGSQATFEHLAVTPEQAQQYALPSAPQKDEDVRGEYMAETWQAEALDPAVLADIVRNRLQELIGTRALDKASRQSVRERKGLLAALDRLLGGRLGGGRRRR